MSTPKLYLIAGPVTGTDGTDLRARANSAATAWDTIGGHLSFLPPMLYVRGQDPTVATHTAIHLRIEDSVAPAIQAAIAANFPGWVMIQNDDVAAALAQAGLGRMTPQTP